MTPLTLGRIYRVAETDYGKNYAAPAVAGKLVRLAFVSGGTAVVDSVEERSLRANVPTKALREAAVAAIGARPSPPPPPPIPTGPTHVPDDAAVLWAKAQIRSRERFHRTPNYVGVVMAAAATAEADEGRRFFTTLDRISNLISLAPSTIRNYLRPIPGVAIDKHGNVLLPVVAEEAPTETVRPIDETPTTRSTD